MGIPQVRDLADLPTTHTQMYPLYQRIDKRKQQIDDNDFQIRKLKADLKYFESKGDTPAVKSNLARIRIDIKRLEDENSSLKQKNRNVSW